LTTKKKQYKIKTDESPLRLYNQTQKSEQDSLSSDLLFCSDTLFTEDLESKKAS